MAKRRYTVVLVPHDSEPSRIVEVSWKVVRAGMLGAGVCVLLAFLLGVAALTRGVAYHRNTDLEQQNQALAVQLDTLHARLTSLNDTIRQISQRDAHIRLLANLDPIDPQVRAAGIGGPAPARHDDEPSGVLGQRTSDIRVDLNALIRRANLLAQSFREAADSLKSHNERLAATPSIMPTQGWLSSAFASMREHPILHIARPHEGIDVSAPMGSPIEAPAAGTVISSGWETGYGNTIEIDHGYGIVTRFAHASKILVHTGQRVSRGQKIALVGNTGLATGPHLHYEVHVNGRPVDPLRYVLPDHVIAD
jgi:cell division protein FtsB/biotin carboxyl carrier protein